MENSTSVKSVATTFGVILGLYSILVLVLLYVFNVTETNWVISIINAAVTIIIFVYGIITFKKKNGNLISLKEALKTGMGIAVLSGVIAAIYTYIHYAFIYPEFSEIIYDKAVAQMAEQKMPAEQMEQALSITEYTTSAWFFSLMGLIGSLFFGFIISLLTGLIIRNDQKQAY